MQIKDIKSREDIEQLVDRFYRRVREDAVIGPIFDGIIGDDWSHHLPIMYSFWGTVLLGEPGYTGNPIKKHIEIDKKIPLEEAHFDRWIELWTDTVDSLFAGANAAEIKQKAKLMLQLISMKVSDARKGNSLY